MNKVFLFLGVFLFLIGMYLVSMPLIPMDSNDPLFTTVPAAIVPTMNAAADIGGVLFLIIGFISTVVGIKIK